MEYYEVIYPPQCPGCRRKAYTYEDSPRHFRCFSCKIEFWWKGVKDVLEKYENERGIRNED